MPDDIPKGQPRANAFFIDCCSPITVLSFGIMVIVGLTGGLGAGKTTIAGLFQEYGAKIIDADELAREVVKPDKPAWKEIQRKFGNDVFHKDKTLNRQALARLVFRNSYQLNVLQRIIHPRVAREQAKRTKEIFKAFPHVVIIYEAALLIEANAHTRMDHVIVVKADRATQISRVCHRDGLTKAEALRRLRHQMPQSKKINYADTVIDGTWPRSRLRPLVKSLYRTYQKEARQGAPEGSPP